MPKEKDPSITVPKTGRALDEQRFQMLKDIAEELTGEIVFPVNIDLVRHVRKVLHAPDLDINQLVAPLSLEPLIAARLLGLAKKVRDQDGHDRKRNLKSAIQRLGPKVVQALALDITAEQLLRAKRMVEFDEFSRQLWDHSLYAACAAHVISKRLTRIDPDEAMLAGMIHDLGAFYLLYRAAQYEELRIRPDTVKYLVSLWHESIGHSLMISLGVPEVFAEAVRDHNQPRQPPHPPKSLSDVVFVSNRIASEKYGWLCQDDGTYVFEPVAQDEPYRELLGEIDAYEKRLRKPFSEQTLPSGQ